MDTGHKPFAWTFAFFALIFGAVLFVDYQSKSYRANCIVVMKDRPATDILAVCK